MLNSRLCIASTIGLILTSGMSPRIATAAGPGFASRPSTARFFTLLPPGETGANALQADSANPKPADPLPDGKGKDVTKRVCSGCHAVTVFSQQRNTPDKWASIVDSMVAKGLDATDDELTTVIAYLSTNLAAPQQNAPAATPPAPPSEPPSAPPSAPPSRSK